MRFIASTIYMSILLPLLLSWAKNEADQRMGKMQDAAYDTPGAESPIPPQVIIGSMGLVGGHFLLGSGMLKQRKRVTLAAFFIGTLIGITTFIFSKRR